MGATLQRDILQASAAASVFPKSISKGSITFSGSDLLLHHCYLAQSLLIKDLALLQASTLCSYTSTNNFLMWPLVNARLDFS